MPHVTTMPEYFDLGILDDVRNTEVMRDEKPRKHFPCFYLTSKEPIELGDMGTAEIQYKLIERVEKDRDGEKEYRYELEVQGIAPIESEEADEDEDETPKRRKDKGSIMQNFGEALDKVKRSRGVYEE